MADTTEFDKAVGRRLAQLQTIAGWTNEELANYLGLKSGSAWSNYVAGTRRLDPEHALKLCDRFGCDQQWIYAGRAGKNEPEFNRTLGELERGGGAPPRRRGRRPNRSKR